MNSTNPTLLPDFEKNIQGRFCHQPFTTLELHLNGNSHVCCPSWNTTSAGEFMKSDMLDIWNSQAIQDIRASIIDGSYKYCDKKACPYIQVEFLPFYSGLTEKMKNYIDNKQVYLETAPENAMFTFDSSCNLSCPTCRSEKVSHTINSSEYKSLNELCHKISNSLLADPLAKLTINITGSGDPFASLAFRHYLESIDGSKHPNLTFHLQTNGLLLTPIMWERLAKIHKNIEQISVSIDAATPETYAIVRKGGSFYTLLENMKFICQLRANKKIIVKYRLLLKYLQKWDATSSSSQKFLTGELGVKKILIQIASGMKIILIMITLFLFWQTQDLLIIKSLWATYSPIERFQ